MGCQDDGVEDDADKKLFCGSADSGGVKVGWWELPCNSYDFVKFELVAKAKVRGY